MVSLGVYCRVVVTGQLFDLDFMQLPESLREAVRHGEVFTRRWVVDTILDLVGYTVDRDLSSLIIVEPACGEGAFLGPIVERLSVSCRRHGRGLSEAAGAIRAFDLLDRNVQAARQAAAARLHADGWPAAEIDEVTSAWVEPGDYLLREHEPRSADIVVGNPPYLRLEDVPPARMSAYRAACPAMGGRADIYIGFYETALRTLKPGGRLGFICADRWMRNQYGRGLRELVVRRYSMDLVVTMHDVDAFDAQVSAYPAITVIRSGRQGSAIVAGTTCEFGPRQAEELRAWVVGSDTPQIHASSFHAARLPHWFGSGDSWPAASPARLAMLEDLEDRFGLLEDRATGTRVGIGVATGADKVFVTHRDDEPDVEADRLLPLAMVGDTVDGVLQWNGHYLVNPWSDHGQLVQLRDYPRLAEYLERHASALRGRYVANKQPGRWYKTIDKIDHHLTAKTKLLFPDMKLTIHPVLDVGGHYPHHNLYYIVSDAWDMRVLGGLLLSKVAEAFVSAYAVKMRGGTLRFQAQYLRKIRIPKPSDISDADQAALADAFDRRDVQAATRAALNAYRILDLPD
jgi:adenine-specific DNA-methyltransferase